MAAPWTMSKLERFAPWIAASLITFPILLFHYPPAGDVPLHEAVIGLLRHWGDPAFVPDNVYVLNLGLANQLFYFLILPLAYVLPISLASKLVVAAAVFFFPIAVAHLADHLRVTRATALVLAPVGLGWMFMYGLLANMIGLDIFLFALPSLDRFCRRPTGRGLAATCGWMLLLHFAHEVTALVAAGTLLLFTLTSWGGWRATAMRLAPVGLAAAAAASSQALASRWVVRNHSYYRGFVWDSFMTKIEAAAGNVYSDLVVAPWVRYVIFGVCQVPVALFAIERWRTRSGKRRTLREWAFDFRFEVLGLSCVALYFAAPARYEATLFIYPRFLTFAWILLTLCACVRLPAARAWSIPRLLTAAAPLVSLVLLWPRFLDADRLYVGLDVAIEHMEPNSTYMVLHIGPAGTFTFECRGAEGHVVGALGGKSFYDYTLSESSPVVQRVETQWDSTFQRMGWGSGNWIPPHDMKRYRYAIMHAEESDLLSLVEQAMKPEGRLVFREGEWEVIESTLPLDPIDAPDDPVAMPPPMTLDERLMVLSGGSVNRQIGVEKRSSASAQGAAARAPDGR